VYIDGVRAELQSIDYQNNILHTMSPVTVANDVGVYLLASYYTVGGYQNRLKGSAPDVGAWESGAGTPVITQAPTAPVLLMPEDGDANVPVTRQVRWVQSPIATSNQLQVSTTSAFLATVADQGGIAGSAYTVPGLAFSTVYYWKVRSSNAAGTSPWSATRRFSTQTSVGNTPDQPVSLAQNYPNPFNPSTFLRYSLQANSRVTLKVFDVRGAEVVTLEDGDRNAGTYEVKFDASRLASGVYYYTLTAAGVSQTKRMLLVR
jgi:hypothetical protein